jgi:hypothetical protein
MFDIEGVAPEIRLALLPFPDLSLQAVTGDVPVIVVVSAPSNHKAKPGMDWGENDQVFARDAATDVTSAIVTCYLIGRN